MVSEWTVVTVIVAVVGLCGAVAKPMISLTKAITKLDATVERVDKRVDEIAQRNRKAHDALFQTMRDHEKRIDDHDRRLDDHDRILTDP